MGTRKKKRALSLFLCAALLFSPIGVTAHAEEPAPCAKTEDCTLSDGHEGECVTAPPANDGLEKNVTGWTFVDGGNLNGGELSLPGVNADHQADFDTVVSLLPTQLSGTVDGEADPATVDITGWSCPGYKQDGDDHWPLTGEYIFTAELEAGYACDPASTVKVTLGGGDVYDFGGLTISGTPTATQESDGQIKLGNGDYTIYGTWNGTLDGVDWSNQKAVITVPNGVTASVTLSDVTIDVSNTSDASAFAVEADGTANITLTGTNTLTSGHDRAGLEVPDGANLTIDGSGSLTAKGGACGAGIGGGSKDAGGTINIPGGTVTATGYSGDASVADGAGIGGGFEGAGGTISIIGGTVNATGGSGGAGIGGGSCGSSGDITIGGRAEVTAVGGTSRDSLKGSPVSNGTICIGDDAVVNASGGIGGGGIGGAGIGGAGIGGGGEYGGAGIGGGASDDTSNNGRVEISGHAVVNATGSRSGAGIGGGSEGAGGTINITGGTVNATGGAGGAGIGGGVGGSGGDVAISGQSTSVTAASGQYANDVGSGNSNGNGGSLSVTDGTTLEMKNTGTNVTNPEYKNCTIIDKNGIPTHYDEFGAKMAETPKITVQPQGQTLDAGDSFTLSVTASVKDGGNLSYQWYSNTENKTTGGTVVGENLATYSPPTNAAGTVYYYVTVTNTNHATTAAVTSDVAAVTVTGGSTGGGGSSGGSVITAPKDSYTVTGDNISRSVSRSDLKKLADTGKSLTLSCDKASMTFDPAALKAILAAVPASAGNITFAAAPADLSAFPDAAKQLGAHPVYDFTISYKDGKGNTVTVPVSFPAGSAAITLTYAPAAAEVTGSLFLVYVDGKGAVTWLDKSNYDNGRVLADAPHFSTYGVAYKAPAQVFTDIAGHWAKQDIEFVAARGLLSGTGNSLFSPDGTMTRGMFVTALGRLAGVNPADYQTRSFTDVKADAYYAAYVEWAAQKGIVSGTGEGLFSPDAPVTREQMAVMMTNYAGQMGYAIPTPLAEAAFVDSDKVSEWAAKEVTAMQRAGIVKGRDGNRFDPQASATRAEVSVVLRRFVEVVIDPATATGWIKNDSGHWLYYKGGAALTGWQTIGKLRYFFNADGVMHEGWKQDESTGKWYYWSDAGAATGWKEIDGKWYYFDENGVMAVNTAVDGYEVGSDGARME